MSTAIKHTNNLICDVYGQFPELEIKSKDFENLMDSLIGNTLVYQMFKLALTHNKVVNIKDKINKILSHIEIPYNKGKAYYCVDYSRREINIFIPVRRLRKEVGVAIVRLFKIFEKEMPKWHVDIRAKLSHIDSWGVSKKDLVETDL